MSNRYSKDKKSRTGFFVTLGLCIAALGAATFLTYVNTGNDVIEQEQPNSVISNAVGADSGQQVQNNLTSSLLASSKEEEKSESSESSKINSSKATKSTESTEIKQTVAPPEALFIYPTSKNIIKPFSNGELVYSLTMNDWRAHDGIDLAAKAGSTVKAISDGLVKQIYDDQSLGKTVVIEHASGLTAYYSGLGDTVLVKENENVAVGKEIGSIKSVPCEVLEENHLHLSIKQNDKFIDPMTVLKKAQADTKESTEASH